jgi:anti-anti-sigma regulatory factor
MPLLKIATRHDPMGPVTLSIAGKCNGGCLGELRRAIERARRAQKQIVIDMSEVTLVDRPSLEFLAAQTRENITLINCPVYIQPWIAKEDGAREEGA